MKKYIMTVPLILMILLSGCSKTADSIPVAETVSTSAQETEISAEIQPDDGQNPVMNFIGNYQNESAVMLVEVQGSEEAKITVTYSLSTSETWIWTMSGIVTYDDNTVTVTYDNGIKEIQNSAENGSLTGSGTDYENAAGTVVFSGNSAVWNQTKEEIPGGTEFSYFTPDNN